MRYDKVDLLLTADGDLSLHNGDLALIQGNIFLQQQIERRVAGSSADDAFDATIYANLEDLLGAPNNEATAQDGVDRIMRALTTDNMFNADDIYVRAVPVSKEQIVYFLFINSPFAEQPLGFEISLHLSAGVTARKVL